MQTKNGLQLQERKQLNQRQHCTYLPSKALGTKNLAFLVRIVLHYSNWTGSIIYHKVADTAHDDSAKQQTHPDPIKTQKKLDEDFFYFNYPKWFDSQTHVS